MAVPSAGSSQSRQQLLRHSWGRRGIKGEGGRVRCGMRGQNGRSIKWCLPILPCCCLLEILSCIQMFLLVVYGLVLYTVCWFSLGLFVMIHHYSFAVSCCVEIYGEDLILFLVEDKTRSMGNI
jgi:hypothetical protein